MQKNRIIYRASLRMRQQFTREDFIREVARHIPPARQWDGSNCWKSGDFTGSSCQDAIAFRWRHDGIGEEVVFHDGMLTTSMSAQTVVGDIPSSFAKAVAAYAAKDAATGWSGGEPIVLGPKDKDTVMAIQSGKLRASLPIIYVTCSGVTFNPIVNTKLLAKDAAGLFLVVEESETGMARMLKDPTSRWMPPFNGAIDIYWPEGGWSRINPARWDHLNSDDAARAMVMEKCACHKHPPMPLCQPDVSVKGLSETAGVECTGSQALPETLKAMRSQFEDRNERMKAVYESYTKEIEQENRDANAKAAAAGNEVRRLKGLLERTRGGTTDVQLICGEEEFYPGEVEDIVLDAIRHFLSSSCDPNLTKRRSHHVLSSILELNSPTGTRERLEETFTNTLSGSQKSTRDDRRLMTSLGFEEVGVDQGTHLKFRYRGDPRYTFTLASSPSDVRAWKNSLADIVNRLLR